MINEVVQFISNRLPTRNKSSSGVIDISINPYDKTVHITFGGYDCGNMNRHHTIGTFTNNNIEAAIKEGLTKLVTEINHQLMMEE